MLENTSNDDGVEEQPPTASNHQASQPATTASTPLQAHEDSTNTLDVAKDEANIIPGTPPRANEETPAAKVEPVGSPINDASKVEDKKQLPSARVTPEKDRNSTFKSYPRVDMVLGNFVAEGGFCSIWEVPTIKDLDSEHWILPPPPQTMPPKKGAGESGRNLRHRKGNSAFGSLGTLALGLASPVSSKLSSPVKHKRGASSPVGGTGPGGIALPPSMKSISLTVVRNFEDPSAIRRRNNFGKAPRSASMSSSDTNSNNLSNSNARSSKNNMRRSISLLGSSKKDGSNKQIDTYTIHTEHANNITDGEVMGPFYVLKCIKPKSFRKPEYLKLALKDMKIEIEMLQRIQHPHIISLKAYGNMEMEQYSSYQEKQVAEANAKSNLINNVNDNLNTIPRYPFVILDRLGGTLNDKLQQWETKDRKLSSMVGKMITHRNHSKATFCLPQRMNVLCDIASALEYLHRHRIVYRDLKPENIGFDRQQDQLKLLDFGLCKDLSRLKPNSSGLYNLTVLTGSARYMAPEVAREDPYNESCDTYGLAIVIWQVMALETPFAKFNVTKMFQQVYDCPHVRPSLEQWGDSTDPSHPFKWLLTLLRRMWSPLIEDRPSIKKVHATLNSQFLKHQQQANEGNS